MKIREVINYAVVFIGGIILGVILTLVFTCGSNRNTSAEAVRTELKIIYAGAQSIKGDIDTALEYNTTAEGLIEEGFRRLDRLDKLDQQREYQIRQLREGTGD